MGACVTGYGTVVLIQWSSIIIRNRWRWERLQRGWDMDCLGWMFFEGKSVQLWVKPYEQSSQWLFVRCLAPFIDYGTIFHWGRTLALGKMVLWSRFCCSADGELRTTNTCSVGGEPKAKSGGEHKWSGGFLCRFVLMYWFLPYCEARASSWSGISGTGLVWFITVGTELSQWKTHWKSNTISVGSKHLRGIITQ